MLAYVVGVVVLLPVLYRVLLTLSCPQCLKPFPEISLVQYLKRTFQRCPVDQRLKFVCDTANEEGLAKIFFAGTWTLVVTNPLYARKILSDIDTFPKQEMKVLLKGYLAPELMGDNVANENGDAWKRHRRVVAPAFHNFQPYVDVFGHSAAEFGDIVRNARSKGGRELDVSNLLSLMTIDIICKAGFSYDLGAMKESATNPWMKHYQDFIAQLFNPLYFLFPMLEKLNIGNRKGVLLASNAGLNDMFYQMIDQRRQEINRWKGQKPDGIEPKSVDPIKDLLALMIQASDAEESSKTSLSPEELRNNLLMFFIAGHETTANSLASTLYYLSVHPEIQEKARLECENAMAGRPKNATATFEEQKKMVYVTGVIKESLRLNAPAGQLSNRIVNKPEGTTLGSHHFPYGTTMQIHMYAMHHNPEVWKNPYDFDPTRFLQKFNQEKGKENPEDGVWTNEYQEKSGGHMSEQERICWSPFGAGPRACLGMNFSLIEQRVFLSHILRQFRLKLPANSKHSNGIINEPFPITKPADMKIIFEELK